MLSYSMPEQRKITLVRITREFLEAQLSMRLKSVDQRYLVKKTVGIISGVTIFRLI